MTRVKPEFRDQVMSMWNADKTSGEIAAALHITRNAVIGIVQRFKGEKRKTTSTVILARQRAPRQPKPWTPPKSKPTTDDTDNEDAKSHDVVEPPEGVAFQ